MIFKNGRKMAAIGIKQGLQILRKFMIIN